MKKNYERPILTTEPFDAEDVVTASSPVQPTAMLGAGKANWEISDIPVDFDFN